MMKGEKRMKKETLKPEQLEAIRAFARIEGRNWKGVLRQSWMTGDYGTHGNISNWLQQIRNSFGPSWLVRFKLTPEPTRVNGLTVLVRTNEAIYIRLPRELQYQTAFASDGCSCGDCDGEGRTDTLGVPINPGPNDYTFAVHMPDKAIEGFKSYMKKQGKEFRTR